MVKKEVLCPRCLRRTVPKLVVFNFFGTTVRTKVCRRCEQRLVVPKLKAGGF